MRELKNFENAKYYLLGLDANDSSIVHFVTNRNWDLMLFSYSLISNDEQRDTAYQEVDMYDEWKKAVADWDTEDSYSDWSDNQDIYDFFDPRNYYEFPSEVYHKCENAWYLNDGEYPDYYGQKEITEENIDDILEDIDETDRDQETYDMLISELGLGNMTFIKTEPIR